MSARVFVGNLSPRTDEEDLTGFFSDVATVVSAAIPRDPETGRKRGFGFVELASKDQAEYAIGMLDGRNLDGREVRLSPARARGEQPDGGKPRPRREGWVGGSASFMGEDDRHDQRRRKPKRGGHGSDRRRGRGTRRML